MITTTEPLDAKLFAQLGPVIRDELLKRVHAGMLRVGDSLQQVFVQLLGTKRTREEWYLFLLFAAPMARKIAMHRASAEDRIGNSHVVVADVRMWLAWLDAMDPLSARMVDLHYFAGLAVKETATVLALPAATIARELRFARAWLLIELD